MTDLDAIVKAVRIEERLKECREILRNLWGREYPEKIAGYVYQLRIGAALSHRSIVDLATEAGRKCQAAGDEYAFMMLLAACLDAVEAEHVFKAITTRAEGAAWAGASIVETGVPTPWATCYSAVQCIQGVSTPGATL